MATLRSYVSARSARTFVFLAEDARMKMKTLVGSLALLGLATHALAQTSGTTQRVEITGSSIKRIATEGALPLQTITRVELDRQGILSAEQLISTLNINGNGLDNLASNADVVSGQARGNNGSTAANLRGQGSNATLVLLNGRRLAAGGLNGSVVDLNQIPFAAVERVEVLKDGASSVYGTDAVGGVINFILRTNFTGLRASATVDVTEDGGGNIYRASLVGGLGNLDSDGYNVLATLSVSDSKRLDGSQRDFVNTFQPERGLSPDTRGAPFATLFAVNQSSKSVMTRPGSSASTGPLRNGVTMNGINVLDLPGGAGCASQPNMGPYDEKIWAAGAGAAYGCAWDTGKAAVIQQPVKNTNLVTRGTFKLGEHQLIGELVLGRSESAKVFSASQITSGTGTSTITLPNGTTAPSPLRNLAYPSTGAGYARVFNQLVAAFPELAVNNGLPMAFRWRCEACGPREYDTVTDAGRVMLAAEGPLPFMRTWDYRVGLSEAWSKSQSTLGSGYQNWLGLANLINNGTLNPFLLAGESQTPAAMAALDAISARGTVLYGGKFTMDEVDATASGPIFKLPGGDVLAAVGVDFRSEKYKFEGNNSVNTNDVSTWIYNAAFDNINALSGVKRDIKAVYGEVILPITKKLELNLSARRDDYTGFGATTNPKVTLRFAPLDSLMLRGSYGEGFRVPTFNQLYNGITESPNTGAGVVDPFKCPSGIVDATPGSPCNAITFSTLFGGKPDLGPETAKMSTVGAVWQPVPEFSASVDWWDIKRNGTIQSFGLATIMANYTLFPQNFIRDASGNIVQIDTRWVNAGETRTKGLEIGLRGNTKAGAARISMGMDISYLLEKKSRLLASSPMGASEIGVFTRSSDLGIRWKHTAFVTYTQGEWSGTLSQVYRGGYAGYVPPGVANGTIMPSQWDPVVKPYSIFHASVKYTGFKNLELSLGVKNLFNTDPPFANAYDTNTGSGSSWEPRVADPRGRSYLATVDYKFF
jgi:iron complex outermembrane receptor protein